ncbi:MAG: DUF262 domain-containing protein, partial [Candidatus Anaerobiospirillum merdipullorum]|nr:DUF262 domain-containing protein [Candidatus Anaerobiospirillum merdipullorum]
MSSTEQLITLLPIRSLYGMHFFIPSYQRGYRWTTQQVKELLEDITDFQQHKSSAQPDRDFYCLQPVVVKPRESTQDFEVIDGQQRLTTIFIILKVLGEEHQEKRFSINYATRPGSRNFLESLSNPDRPEAASQTSNIDFYYMDKTYRYVKKWQAQQTSTFLCAFVNTLEEQVKIIWYQLSAQEDPIKVFTRLNIGKIPLTCAELIKALLLKRDPTQLQLEHRLIAAVQAITQAQKSGQIPLISPDTIIDALQWRKVESWQLQYKIAKEWDRIEATLQNDDFWLFIHHPDDDLPVRIGFLFDLLCDLNSKATSSDPYRAFAYLQAKLHNAAPQATAQAELIWQCWQQLTHYFAILQTWFNDLTLYHYVGFLICEQGKDPKTAALTLRGLIQTWEMAKSKADFLAQITTQIKDLISSPFPHHDLNKYDYTKDDKDKSNYKSVLLFHNVQTVINQNIALQQAATWHTSAFSRFPFGIFKREHWDVEHVHSFTDNDLSDDSDFYELLVNSYPLIIDAGLNELKVQIDTYVKEKNSKQEPTETITEPTNALTPK